MIVIPMAGMSSRFFKAGYTKPKYMLEAHGDTLFDHSVKSFQAYFSSLPFLFIVRDIYETEDFVRTRAQKLGIEKFYIVVLDKETRGQAETVALGLELLEQQRRDYQEPITVFNIDTFRPNFEFPDVSKKGSGYLEVFKGSGDNWSFALPEKRAQPESSKPLRKTPYPIFAAQAFTTFASKHAYLSVYQEYVAKPQEEWEKGELYIAPLYNLMIEKGADIHYHLIERDDVVFCGIPDEYTDFLDRD